jgi:hypothetical protein
MTKPTTFIISAGLGLWFALLIYTGIDVSEEGIMQMIIDALENTSFVTHSQAGWLYIVMIVISLITPVYLVWRVYCEGIKGIAAALCGFIGVFVLVSSVYHGPQMIAFFSVPLLFVGGLISPTNNN